MLTFSSIQSVICVLIVSYVGQISTEAAYSSQEHFKASRYASSSRPFIRQANSVTRESEMSLQCAQRDPSATGRTKSTKWITGPKVNCVDLVRVFEVIFLFNSYNILIVKCLLYVFHCVILCFVVSYAGTSFP